MAQGDLTSLSNLKAWIGATTTTNDVALGRLVSAASATVTKYLGRPFIGSTLVTERYDGRGGDSLSLRHGPVSSVVSINFGGVSITTPATGNPPTGGYLLDNSSLTGRVVLTDTLFTTGKLQVQVSYWAGWQVAAEPHVAAATVKPTLTWTTDAGVTYASGAAMTAVAANPAVGQYVVNAGVYSFNATDVTNAAAVLITYGTVPYDVEQAVIELAGETYKRADRIGLNSKTLAGQEIISFSQLPMGRAIQDSLNRYRRLAPI